MSEIKIEPKLARIREMITEYNDVFDLMEQDVRETHFKVKGENSEIEIISHSEPVQRLLNAKLGLIFKNYFLNV